MATFDSKGNAFADLFVYDNQQRAIKGAPTASIYESQKATEEHKIRMAYYVANSQAGLESEPPSALVANLHRLFMQQFMEDLVGEAVNQGESNMQYPIVVHIQAMNSCYSTHALLLHCPTTSSQVSVHIQLNLPLDLTQTGTQTTSLLTGFGTELAANKAVLHPLLQLLEAKDIWIEGKGQLTFTAATKAGAQVLRQITHLEFGIH